jgi:NADPH2:quinone reductase
MCYSSPSALRIDGSSDRWSIAKTPGLQEINASRKATIDVTDLIWKRASIQSFVLFTEPQSALADAWNTIVSLLQSGAIKPIVAKTFPLAKAAEALRYLVEDRPFGRVVLTI